MKAKETQLVFRPRILQIALVLVLSCTVVACHSVRRGEPLVPPVTSSDPAIERGRLAFAKHCYKCHPGGEGGLGPALNNKPIPRVLMKTQVRLGLGAMPSFDGQTIPPDELDVLAVTMQLD